MNFESVDEENPPPVPAQVVPLQVPPQQVPPQVIPQQEAGMDDSFGGYSMDTEYADESG